MQKDPFPRNIADLISYWDNQEMLKHCSVPFEQDHLQLIVAMKTMSGEMKRLEDIIIAQGSKIISLETELEALSNEYRGYDP